mmetsp:Transcript_10807/g.21697  ORF Transcript_10807/g.21697 Transcript_10807/m.21697 type:complete len:90 (+) Transcript_10807:149-418(+)|eukprot:CAMPEP_0184679294 /NCGR_PEP_ID=MMETSP0312-20130426/2124_1 /TAXON_ID=31354 /ORGANISM="Compsopogon coeruleus, Strain SAG 36.94" /LENGTH=89 /DNA_ID=CAMNT_0027128643 /DNA_START=128 /DNA_END=397 /DNA_ORIENTATION=+
MDPKIRMENLEQAVIEITQRMNGMESSQHQTTKAGPDELAEGDWSLLKEDVEQWKSLAVKREESIQKLQYRIIHLLRTIKELEERAKTS